MSCPTTCPKCSGRFLYKESDMYGESTTCGSCGWCSDVATIPTEILDSISEMRDDGSIRQRRRDPRMAVSH